MTSDEKPQSGRRAAARPASRVKRARLAIAGGAVALAAVVGGVLIWSPSNVRTVEAGGVTFSTNLELRESGDVVLAFVSVNTDNSSLVLEMGDDHTDAIIDSFIERLDTFVPGEHVLEADGLPEIRVIVDGIDGQPGSVLEQFDEAAG